ncbi:O-acetyl-ADP-ribose deacetylase MACROD2-like protein, partial [Euroglyphus maynei]
DGFIHRAAGYEDLQAECRTLNGCRTGDCKITGDIIHCVGPIGEKPDLLANCYRRALDLLRDNQLRSIAFPCISTGIFGYPNENAANVALETVRKWLENNSTTNIDRIIFCLFLDQDIEIYNRLIGEYFPPPKC